MRSGACVVAVLWALLFASDAVGQTTWTQYLGGAAHRSFTTNGQITKASAPSLRLAWSWKPDPPTMSGQPTSGMFASPTVYNHRIYIGAYTGVFYALDEATGRVLWKRFLGFQPSLTCGQALGFVSTAAVATAPNSTGTSTIPVVYVAAPNGYLYALDGVTGATRWRSLIQLPSTTVNDSFNWSSPTLVGNRIYVGFSSNCDFPWTRGGLALFDRTSGARTATFYSVPPGSIGGGVWTSAAAATDAVFITTGSTCEPGVPAGTGCTSTNQYGDSYSLVRLNPSTLEKVAAWKVPKTELYAAGDPDWGSSPIIFSRTINGTVQRLVGACHKNGTFYALRTGSFTSPLWKRKIGTAGDDGGNGCLASAIFDGSRLFLAGNDTTIGGIAYQGSIRRVNPATGTSIWERGLSANVLGTPAENGAGVIAAATHDFIPAGLTNQTYLIDAATGAVLKTIANGKQFAQPVFADQYLLLTAAYTNTLSAYSAP